jgi:hypothetical protein
MTLRCETQLSAETPQTTVNSRKKRESCSRILERHHVPVSRETGFLRNDLTVDKILIPDGQDYHSGLEEFNAQEVVMKHTTTGQLQSQEGTI